MLNCLNTKCHVQVSYTYYVQVMRHEAIFEEKKNGLELLQINLSYSYDVLGFDCLSDMRANRQLLAKIDDLNRKHR